MSAGSRRILILAYTYPPMPTIGAARWDSMARHLRALGHEVRVVSTSAFGELPDDGELVQRTPDLTASPLARRLLRRPPLVAAEGPAGANSPAPAPMMRLVVPDPYVLSWVPMAVGSLRRVMREWPPDCLISTSPYESTHVAPLLLGARRPPWLLDLRDGWCFEPHRLPFYTGAQQRLDRWLEARALRTADGVLAATMPIAEDAERRLGVAAAYVPNGWDPDLEPGVPAGAPPDLDPDRVNLVYTGTLSGTGGRDPRPLLEGMRRFGEREPGTAERLRLVIAGQPGADDERLIAESGVGDRIQHLGRLSRPSAIALQRSADALLLLTSVAGSEATGKLFEYLSSGRPILALTGASEAARVISETSTGEVVAADDPAAIAEALAALARGDMAASYAPRGLERYIYPAPAEAVVLEVERALARHGR